jgi:hypothetical protein
VGEFSDRLEFIMATVPRLATFAGVCVTAALLVMASPGFAANDDFAHARTLRVGATLKGSIKGATKQRGEPRHGGSLATHSVWYRFRAKRKLALGLSTCSANFDSVLAVYSGRSLRSLRAVEFNNDGCGSSGGGSRVTFTARRGRTYRIAVAGFAAKGKFRLEATRVATPPNDDFVDAVPIRLGESIPGTTRNATRERGEPRHNFNGPHTVWFRFSVAAAGEARLETCSAAGYGPGIAMYTGGRVDRLTQVAATDSCRAQFAAQPGVSYRVVVEGSGSGGGFRLRARTAMPPANDDFANATPITLGSSTNATSRDASREPSEPRGYGYPHPFTVWFRLSVAATTTVAFNACASPFSVRLNIYRGDQLSQLTPLNNLGCGSTVELELGVYSIQAEADTEGDFNLSAQAVPPPP